MIAEAVERSEELSALRERIEAAEARVRPSGALPDPVASVALSNVPVGGLELNRTPMSGIEIGLEQRLPASSKRRLRGTVQSQEAEALQARYDERRNDLVRRVRQVYYDVQYQEAALRIAQENRSVAEDLLKTAEARYGTGKGLQQDVFQAQVQLSRMIDAEIAARKGREAAATRLNKLLYRDPNAPAPALPPLDKGGPIDASAARSRALQENPQVWVVQKRLEQASSKVELAHAGLKPDYSVGFRYRIRQEVPGDPVSGNDFWSASVAMTLPWFNRRNTVDEEVRSAEADSRAAEADLQALRNDLAAQVEDTSVQIGQTDEQLSLIDTALLPQAEGALSSSWSAYRTGKLELVNALDNQMNLYNLYLQRSRLLADRARAVAELDYLAGEPTGPRQPESGAAAGANQTPTGPGGGKEVDENGS